MEGQKVAYGGTGDATSRYIGACTALQESTACPPGLPGAPRVGGGWAHTPEEQTQPHGVCPSLSPVAPGWLWASRRAGAGHSPWEAPPQPRSPSPQGLEEASPPLHPGSFSRGHRSPRCAEREGPAVPGLEGQQMGPHLAPKLPGG